MSNGANHQTLPTEVATTEIWYRVCIGVCTGAGASYGARAVLVYGGVSVAAGAEELSCS
ncbi:hypothetical protein E1A91_A06G041600v1 [Gossypium mustelinum]|uniref:Uncharacterized protein n=1 Tax=Gossypium mustelinum TaxID=34275 RepID=A0A5D2YT43_GOSMU|nr:hypothetical protein E1A91_A06G041600v1 [Gossypium mustelinum]